MKLSKTFEKFRNHQLQVIVLWCEVHSRKEIVDIPYEDFRADLYINHKFVADISHVLSNAGVFITMVESEDWEKLYNEQTGVELYERQD